MLRHIRQSLVLKTAMLVALAALVPFVLASAFLFRSACAALYAEIVTGLDVRVGLMRDTLDARLAALATATPGVSAQAHPRTRAPAEILLTGSRHPGRAGCRRPESTFAKLSGIEV